MAITVAECILFQPSPPPSYETEDKLFSTCTRQVERWWWWAAHCLSIKRAPCDATTQSCRYKYNYLKTKDTIQVCNQIIGA